MRSCTTSILHDSRAIAIPGYAAQVSVRAGSVIAHLASLNRYGLLLPFMQALDAAAQLPRSGHWTRCAAYCFVRGPLSGLCHHSLQVHEWQLSNIPLNKAGFVASVNVASIERSIKTKAVVKNVMSCLHFKLFQ
jgi:hypothetical protein